MYKKTSGFGSAKSGGSGSRVSTRQRAAFFLANVGNIPVMSLAAAYLSIFYVSVLGMDEIKVGTMFLIARLFDGINDPFIGYFIDRMPNSKFGKFRKTLLVGTLICSLNYCLLWFGAAAAPESMRLLVAYVSYLLLGITFPVMDISINSMLPVMTDDLKERNFLSAVKTIGYGVGASFCSLAAPLILSALGAGRTAYLTVAGIGIVIIVTCSTIGTLGMRQNIVFEREKQKQYQLKDLLKIMTVAPVLVTFAVTLISGIGVNFVGTCNTYYARYVLGDVGRLASFSVSQMVGNWLFVLLVPFAANRFGKKTIYGTGIAVLGLGYLIKAICPDASGTGLLYYYLSAFVCGAGGCFSSQLTYGIQADNIDYIEYKMNARCEGAVSALNSMVTKIGMGLGGALPLYVLGLTKAADGSYSVPALVFCSSVLPCVLCVIAGILFAVRYPLNSEKMEHIQTELQRRRTQE